MKDRQKVLCECGVKSNGAGRDFCEEVLPDA